MTMELGAIVPCHDDSRLLGGCLEAIRKAGRSRVVVVVDRCSDSSREVAAGFPEALLLEKRAASWRNSTAENIELGLRILLDADYVAVVGADTLVPPDFWSLTVAELERSPSLASVSGVMHSADALYRSYELFLERIGLEHKIRSSGRVYRMSLVRRLLLAKDGRALEKGFIAEDTRLDDELGGERAVVPGVSMVDIRPWGLRKSVLGQFRSGMARRQLGRPLKRSLGELPRLRPFVLAGWLLGGEAPQ